VAAAAAAAGKGWDGSATAPVAIPRSLQGIENEKDYEKENDRIVLVLVIFLVLDALSGCA
jgi:hypothetical protein